MFGDVDVAFVCLRNQHGWNTMKEGDSERYEVKEDRR